MLSTLLQQTNSFKQARSTGWKSRSCGGAVHEYIVHIHDIIKICMLIAMQASWHFSTKQNFWIATWTAWITGDDGAPTATGGKDGKVAIFVCGLGRLTSVCMAYMHSYCWWFRVKPRWQLSWSNVWGCVKNNVWGWSNIERNASNNKAGSYQGGGCPERENPWVEIPNNHSGMVLKPCK